MDKPDRIEIDARKDNTARALARQAIEIWAEIGYSEEEIAEFVEELYEEVVSWATESTPAKRGGDA